MKQRYTIILFLALLGTVARADDGVLTKATLFTHTNDEDKDWNTCILVEVKTPDGDLIAHAYNADCSNADGSQYKDGSDHQFDLAIDSPGLARNFAKGFKVHMWQETHGGAGHDTWRFNVHVILFFSGGAPNLTGSRDGIELKSNGTGDRPSTDFSNAQ
ncbi:MAG: hypothetical protein ACLQU1_01545 [Bryobacteraceae bacterium]